MEIFLRIFWSIVAGFFALIGGWWLMEENGIGSVELLFRISVIEIGGTIIILLSIIIFLLANIMVNSRKSD